MSAEQDVQQADGGWVVWERGGGLTKERENIGLVGKGCWVHYDRYKIKKGFCRAGGRVGRQGF